MAASQQWTRKAAKVITDDLGKEDALRVVTKLAHVPGANASVNQTMYALRREIKAL